MAHRFVLLVFLLSTSLRQSFAELRLRTVIEWNTEPCAYQRLTRIQFWLDYSEVSGSVRALNVVQFTTSAELSRTEGPHTPPTTDDPDQSFWDDSNPLICYSYVGIGQPKGVNDCTTTVPGFVMNKTTLDGGWICNNPVSNQAHAMNTEYFFVLQLTYANAETIPEVGLTLQVIMSGDDHIVRTYDVSANTFTTTTAVSTDAPTTAPPGLDGATIFGIVFVIFLVGGLIMLFVWIGCVFFCPSYSDRICEKGCMCCRRLKEPSADVAIPNVSSEAEPPVRAGVATPEDFC
jgi:hypothetical protein